MNAPLLSTVSLVTELIITFSIFYIFYKGYVKGIFHSKLALVTILYELIFNISYMATRTPQVTQKTESVATPFAIFHGILSLTMFVLLIIFLLVAWTRYKKEINFFKNHKLLTILFLIFWTASVTSGIAFYVMRYVLHI